MKTIPTIKTVVIHFFTSKDKKLIGKNEKGKIVFPKKSSLIKSGETWEVEIVKEMANFMLANPLFKIKTVSENKQDFNDSLNKLKSKFIVKSLPA